eukprot:1762458-Amphidinium_carterae.1
MRLHGLAEALAKDPDLAKQLASEPKAEAAISAALDAAIEIEPAIKEYSGAVESEIPAPTRQQLKNYGLLHAVPFIGFGFCDNGVMLIAGDLIDAKLGVAFGISTLAAAAVGNTCSNVVGLWASGIIETAASMLGIPPHGLSQAQQDLLYVRIMKNTSSIIGIIFGCTLGMFPLKFPEEWRLWEARSAEA